MSDCFREIFFLVLKHCIFSVIKIEKKMDIYRICRTCLNESQTNLVSIHSPLNSYNDNNLVKIENDENYTDISHILDDLTENKYVCISFQFS